MDIVTATVLTVAAVILVIVAVFHRSVPSDWLIERPLRRLPSTPSIIERVVGARRRQLLWSCLCGLAGLGIGILLRLAEPAATVPDRWRPGISLLYFTVLGLIAGSVINLARNGYAFADRDGPRVARSRRRSIRSLVGIWPLLISHLCVAITTIVTLSLVMSPAGRATLTSSDALEPADTLVVCTLAVVVLIVCDVLIVWINQLPSSAGTDLELVWDEAVKAITAQRLLEYAPATAGCSTTYLYITFFSALHPAQTVALVVAYVLWFASTFLPAHLPSKPAAPVVDERVPS